MASKVMKFLCSTTFHSHNPLLGVFFKKCHLQTTRSISAIVSSAQLSSLSTKPVNKIQDSEVEPEILPPTKKEELATDAESPTSLKSRLMRIVTEEDDTFQMPEAADSHRSQSIFDDQLTNKFVNCMMWDGKRSTSQRIFNEALKVIKKNQLRVQNNSQEPESVVTDPVAVFHQAVENVKPIIGIIPLRKAGKVYQVPSPLKPVRRQFFAIQWIIEAARKTSGSNDARMSDKLAKELLDAYNNEGTAIRKKQDLHKTAEANRAFAHYRWW